MSEFIEIETPLDNGALERLRAGDMVKISGVVYTARDAAHKRFVDLLDAGKPLPFDIEGQIIYYVGPAPAKPGAVIGPAGPTTSYRMDPYAPRLMEIGMKGMIGKGGRSMEVIDAMKRFKCVYFAAIGGAASLIARSIKKVDIIAYDDLGAEAVRRMEVEGFQAIVANDIYGSDIYEIGRKRYAIK